MHKIIYSENAVRDFEHIVFDLTEYAGFSSAITIFEDIKQAIELLAYMPLMGVAGRVEGTREIYVRGCQRLSNCLSCFFYRNPNQHHHSL